MAAIIGIHHVVELNSELKNNDIPVKIHLHDACGGQTLTLEFLADKSQAVLEHAQRVISDYLARRAIRVEFDQLTGTTFRAV